MTIQRREVLKGMLSTIPALAVPPQILPPYRCGPDCNSPQWTNMQTWNVKVSNVAAAKKLPTKAQLYNAADRIETFVFMLENNGHLAAFQRAMLAYFENPANFLNAQASATQMWEAFLQFGGTITVNQIQTELDKVQLGDRQSLVTYIQKYGVGAWLQELENGLRILAIGSHFREYNKAQRVFFDGCLVLGAVLLFPEFAGVAAAVAIGEGLVVAGGIGTLVLDIYGE